MSWLQCSNQVCFLHRGLAQRPENVNFDHWGSWLISPAAAVVQLYTWWAANMSQNHRSSFSCYIMSSTPRTRPNELFPETSMGNCDKESSKPFVYCDSLNYYDKTPADNNLPLFRQLLSLLTPIVAFQAERRLAWSHGACRSSVPHQKGGKTHSLPHPTTSPPLHLCSYPDWLPAPKAFSVETCTALSPTGKTSWSYNGLLMRSLKMGRGRTLCDKNMSHTRVPKVEMEDFLWQWEYKPHCNYWQRRTSRSLASIYKIYATPILQAANWAICQSLFFTWHIWDDTIINSASRQHCSQVPNVWQKIGTTFFGQRICAVFAKSRP